MCLLRHVSKTVRFLIHSAATVIPEFAVHRHTAEIGQSDQSLRFGSIMHRFWARVPMDRPEPTDWRSTQGNLVGNHHREPWTCSLAKAVRSDLARFPCVSPPCVCL